MGKGIVKSVETVSADRRAVRTRRMIKEALYRLLDKKNLQEISITDITEEADINRGTFYLHYIDKPDLLNTLEDEILEGMIAYAKKTSFDGVFELDEKDLVVNIRKPIPFVEKLFEFLHENKVFAKAILGPNGDPNFQLKMKATMLRTLFNDHYILNVDEGKMLVPKEYFMSYVLSAHMGVAYQWLQGDMKRTPAEMAMILTKLFVLGPFRVTGVNPREGLVIDNSDKNV